MRALEPIRSDIAWSSAEKVSVRGLDLSAEILGCMNLGDFAFLQLTGHAPTPEQSRMYNAIIIALVEHGITPSVIAARMTYAGAPEAPQAAVAAGLCGLGSVFVGSMEGAARMLSEALADAAGDVDLGSVAESIVTAYFERGELIPGIGHPVHKPTDPRAKRLFELARDNGFAGPYVHLIQQVAAAAERVSNKQLPVNATGAVGAICCELDLPWTVVRGVGVMGRAIGLVGHLFEESKSPMAHEIWRRVEDEASAQSRLA